MLFCCINNPNANICTFLNAGVLFDGAFSLWVSLTHVNEFNNPCFVARKFYIKKNKNKVSSIETGCTVTAYISQKWSRELQYIDLFSIVHDKNLW